MARYFVVLLLSLGLTSQDAIDPTLRAAVEKFFSTQQAEDADGYMALWAKTAKRPQLASLKFIFESGDDIFENLEIARATISGDTARVRVSVTRIRTQSDMKNADGSPRRFTSRLHAGLTFVREGDEWKLVREGRPGDELAEALVAEPDAAKRAALLAAEGDLTNFRLVESLGRLADDFTVKYEYRQAQRIYEIALEVARAIKDRKAEGLMLQNVANSLYFQQRHAEALATYEGRLALERDTKNEEGVASALVGIATIKYSTYEYGEALKLYRQALEIQERVGDQSMVSTTLISTGNVLYLQGDYEGAIADYRRAEALKRKFYDLGGAAVALESLGRAYAAQGDYADALLAFSRVLADSRKRVDTARAASALQNMGEVHTRLLNLDAARAAFDESRKISEERKDVGQAGRSLQGTAIVELLSGRLPQAQAAYEKSHALCSARLPQPDEACIAQALVGLGFAQASQEKWDDAIGSYRKGITAFLALRASEGAARAQVGLAEAFIGKEEFVSGLSEATGARATAVALDADDLLWRALVSQSRAQRRLKRPADALGSARAAVLAVRRMAASAAQRPAAAPPRDTAAAFAAAAVLHAEAGDAVAAWNVAEEMRAHTLRTALALNERDIAAGMTDEERASELAFAAELNPLLAQREREKNLPKPDPARLKKLEAAIAAATQKRDAWFKGLFTRLPQLSLWRGFAPPARTEDIMPLLGDGDVIVQFVIEDHDLLVLTAGNSGGSLAFGAHVVPIKRAQLAERIAKALDGAALTNADAWRKGAAEFANKLLPQEVIDRMASARRLVIVPDDILWRVPFEALPAGEAYLGDVADVRYAASLTSLVREPAAGAATPFRVAVINGPQLPVATVEMLSVTAPSWALRPVDVAQVETARLLGMLADDVDVLSGSGATEDAFRAVASTASVVHVTGPFRVNAASPLFSPMMLATGEPVDPPQTSRDGVFEAREAATASLAARTLLISDPAALTMRDAAAAMPAFQWAWRAGGVETVLVRRWASDESATGDLLSAFYAALHGGATAPDAMRAARATVRKANPALPPSVWAGWLLLSGR